MQNEKNQVPELYVQATKNLLNYVTREQRVTPQEVKAMTITEVQDGLFNAMHEGLLSEHALYHLQTALCNYNLLCNHIVSMHNMLEAVQKD